MCGIAGSLDKGPPSSIDLTSVAERLRHRGPDGEATERFQGDGWSALIHHARLAINDLSSSGRQPMRSACSSLILAYNGEIYNYPELRRMCEAKGHTFASDMDGEVILHLWEEEGEAALKRLNGIYAIAILDGQSGRLLLARDPMGAKPLFYALENRGGLRFASEIRSLTKLIDRPLTEDIRALGAFLTFLWIPAPWTPYQELRSLRPGEVLSWFPAADTAVRMGPAALQYSEDLRQTTAAVATDELRGLLEESVARQLLSDVPMGIMASGGVDSTLLWSRMHGNANKAYTSVTSGHGQEGLYEDASAAKAFAEESSTDLVRVPVPDAVSSIKTLSGDLIADPAYLLTRSLAREAARDGVKVLFSGQGADELLGGYRRHSAARLLEATGGIPTRTVGALLSRVPRRPSIRGEYLRRLTDAATQRDEFTSYSRLYTYSTAQQRARLLQVTEDEVSDDVILSEHRSVWDGMPQSWTMLKKALTLDLQVYLPGLGLNYVDRATMVHGVEGRVPWLDLEMVNWALSLEPSCLFHRGRGKVPARLLAQSLPRFVWDRPKRGFAVPVENLDTSGSGVGRQERYVGMASRIVDDWRLSKQSGG